MKELENIKPDKVKQAEQRQIEKLLHIDSLIPYPGQKLWELNKQTGTITEVPLKTTSADYTTKQVISKAIMNEGCMYVLAINKANAQKKFFRQLR